MDEKWSQGDHNIARPFENTEAPVKLKVVDVLLLKLTLVHYRVLVGILERMRELPAFENYTEKGAD
jgi:hypothetical protein